MEFESKRLETYEKWNKSYIDIRNLASSGLYYTGTNDNVICAFCKTGIHQFDGTDVSINVHSKFSSRCLQRYDPRNIPLERTNEEIALIRLRFNEIYKFLENLKHTDSDKKLLDEFSNELSSIIPHKVFGNTYTFGQRGRDVVG